MAIVRQSRYSFGETTARLRNTIAAAGATVFATIDQAAAAVSAGLTLRPTTLIVFGNPKAGTALMQRFPLIALDLPLKILFWEEASSVSVAYTPTSEVAARYGVSEMDAVIHAIDASLASLADSVCALHSPESA